MLCIYLGGGSLPSPELLLHFNGSDGSTTFVDSSVNGHTVTGTGAAQIDTAQSQFGGSSLLVPDTVQSTITSHNWTTQPWGVSMWVRFASLPGSQALFSVGSGGDPMYVHIIGSTVYWGDNSTNLSFGWSPAANTWYHVGLTHDVVAGNHAYRMFVDGALHYEVGGSSSLSTGAQTVVHVGGRPSQGAYLNGWIDDFVVVLGSPIWTAAFTPPGEWP